MKPEQFIRDYGVEKAREVVEGMPECSNHYKFSEYASIDQYYSIHTIPLKWNNYSKTWYQLRKKPKDLVDLIDLKRLVESLEIIETVGYDRDGAEEIYEFSKDCEVIHYAGLEIKVTRLAQAIKDHESIYGGGDA